MGILPMFWRPCDLLDPHGCGGVPVWIVPQQASYSGSGPSVPAGARGFFRHWRWRTFAMDATRRMSSRNLRFRQCRPVRSRVLGPVLARVGMDSVYHAVAILLVIWAVVFGLLARNAPAAATTQRKSLGAVFEVFAHEKLSWLLSAFYFLTFGGFVAFSIYLPTLLRDEFHLTPADAGFRTAGFVVLATLLSRWAGGSDALAARVLSAVFLGVAPFALLWLGRR